MVRNRAFDNAKLLMVFLVVLGHLIEPLIKQSDVMKVIYMSVYSFHMPVFVLLAGALSKSEVSKEVIIKNSINIIIPFIVFTVLYEIYNLIVAREISHYTLSLQPYWILWFLFSLFIWKTLLPIIMQFRYPLLLSILISLGAGFIGDVGYFLGISRTLYFLPFFIFGYMVGQSFLSDYFLKKLPKVFYLSILVLNISIFWLLKDHPHQWLYGSFSYERLGVEGWYALVMRAFLYFVSFTTSIAVLMLMSSNESKLSYAGENSLFIYLWHGFFVKLLVYFGLVQMLGNLPVLSALAIAVLAAIVITGFLSTDAVARETRKIFLQPTQRLFLIKNSNSERSP